MKKKIALILTFVLCLILCACGEENKKTSEGKNRSEEIYYFADEIVWYDDSDNELYRTSIAFNDEGLPEKVAMSYADDESEYPMMTIEYDGKGNVELISNDAGIYEINEQGDVTLTDSYTAEYKYDNNGNILELIEIYNGEIGYKRWNEYDDNGLMTYSKQQQWEGGEPIDWSTNLWTYEHKYDSDGNMIEKTGYRQWFDEEDKIVDSIYKYEYVDGQIVAEVYTQADSSEVYRTEYEYDEDGNIIKVFEYFNDELIGYCVISYRHDPKILTKGNIRFFTGEFFEECPIISFQDFITF